jgi:heavy metal translocating P-type ATPase
MGYPCALGMATPLALIRGGGIAAQHGILMRSGEAFQVFKDVRRVVLDKTGTITRGEPRVTDVVPFAGVGREELLRLAAAAESNSEHPLARAIVDYADDSGLDVPDAAGFEAVAGRGVRATVDGRPLLVGSPRFIESEGTSLDPAVEQIVRLEAQGRTVVGIASDGQPLGLIAIADTLKEDAREAVERMKAAGMVPVMLTGDNWRTARAVAAEVGIEEVLAEVLPDQKAARVRELQGQGHRVAMVGDGINDAPALMQADVGVAIGAGTDIAIESSDVILIGERLGSVVDAYHIAGGSYRKTVQNLSLAFAFNGIGVPAAATGLVHPVWAMIAMLASVSTVLLNSFGGRLLPKREEAAIARHEATAAPDEERAVLVLTVPTIHCEGCVRSIKEALAHRDGVEDVDVELAEKRATVLYVPGLVSEAEIREEIERAGHVAIDIHALKHEAEHVA